MSLGVSITTRTAPPSRGAPTDGSTLFVAGKAGTGPTDVATELRSLNDFTGAYGTRNTNNRAAYDYLETFFREGGSHAYFGRYETTSSPAQNVDDALALFVANYGPGQVVAPQETPGADVYDALQSHGEAFGRVPLLDVAVDTFDAGNEDERDALAALIADQELAGFGPWVTVPAPSGVTGVGAREVPASAVVAGLIARADRLGNPNRAAAGRDFPLQYATGFVADVPEDDREELLGQGLNCFADIYGVLELYGFQTGIAQSEETPFWQLNCVRTRMIVSSRAKAIGENYMFKPIDGRGIIESNLKSDLEHLLSDFYLADALYGATPREAYAVEVGASVNTVDTIAQGELHASAELRLSLHAKSIGIQLVSVPVAGQVSA
ncbi:MAG: hypothetical protein JWM47_4538 [Acidimicrobiales bacterium]|nr:hypothetical protein [Acidimicrobiales bacterium]